jgi:hypothetical protein
MSIYIDTITFLWASWLLIEFSRRIFAEGTLMNFLGVVATSLYLLAQSGWTTAFFLGDVWGRDFSNLLWFAFNSVVFTILTCFIYRGLK